MRILLLVLSIILTVLGIIVSVIFFLKLGEHFTYQGKGEILMSETGQVGDFIGGVVGTVFSLAGFILLLLTLYDQARSTKVDRFENKFFELIRLHRENVDEIHVSRNVKDKVGNVHTQEYVRRRAFRIIMADYFTCKNDLDPFFSNVTEQNIYEDKYQAFLSVEFKKSNRNIELKKHARIDIAYCIIFFGVANEGTSILKSLFAGKYKSDFTNNIIEYMQMKPIESSEYWNRWKYLKKMNDVSQRFTFIKRILEARKIKESKRSEFIRTNNLGNYFYENDYVKYFGGHQHRLGHYFRHLYQAFQYINNQKSFSKKEKYFYAKTLRAQLSTHEQEVIFINSLSILGLAWELVPKYKRSQFEYFDQIRRNKSALISNYNLIKNVPGEHLYGTYYKVYYPSIQYEFGESIL